MTTTYAFMYPVDWTRLVKSIRRRTEVVPLGWQDYRIAASGMEEQFIPTYLYMRSAYKVNDAHHFRTVPPSVTPFVAYHSPFLLCIAFHWEWIECDLCVRIGGGIENYDFNIWPVVPMICV